MACCLPHAQVDLSIRGCDRRQPCTTQYDHQSHMEHHHMKRAATGQQPDQTENCRQGPQHSEPPRAVNSRSYRIMPHPLFDKRSGRHDSHQQIEHRESQSASPADKPIKRNHNIILSFLNVVRHIAASSRHLQAPFHHSSVPSAKVRTRRAGRLKRPLVANPDAWQRPHRFTYVSKSEASPASDVPMPALAPDFKSRACQIARMNATTASRSAFGRL